jgi:hypothetical protein
MSIFNKYKEMWPAESFLVLENGLDKCNKMKAVGYSIVYKKEKRI